jgi:hypothetical protein
MKLEFSRQIFEKSSNIKYNKDPVGAELFHADRRQADRRKLTVAFRSFANAPEKRKLLNVCISFIDIPQQ